MTTYEYMEREVYWKDEKDHVSVLNELGKEGWKAINFIQTEHSVQIVLMREILPPQPFTQPYSDRVNVPYTPPHNWPMPPPWSVSTTTWTAPDEKTMESPKKEEPAKP